MTAATSGPPSIFSNLSTWWSQILAASSATGLNPNLLGSLIENESGGNPNAVSKTGAIGLTQLEPATAADLGVNPADPNANIFGGAKYLAQQLQTFGGNLDEALAAYNAGPAAVQSAGGVPPYPETQSYVSNVEGTFAQAQAQSGGASPASECVWWKGCTSGPDPSGKAYGGAPWEGLGTNALQSTGILPAWDSFWSQHPSGALVVGIFMVLVALALIASDRAI